MPHVIVLFVKFISWKKNNRFFSKISQINLPRVIVLLKIGGKIIYFIFFVKFEIIIPFLPFGKNFLNVLCAFQISIL